MSKFEKLALDGWRCLEPGDIIRSTDRRVCGSPVSPTAVGVTVDWSDHDQFIRLPHSINRKEPND